MERKVLIIVAAALCLGAAAAGVRAEDWPLGFPTANPPSANAVPIETLRKIALNEAKETWGEVTPGPEIPCRDQKGATLTYMFIFRKGAGPFGEYSDILDNVRTGRRLYEEGSGEMRKMLPQALLPVAMSAGAGSPETQAPTVPPALRQPSPELLKAQEKFQTGRKMRSGAGEYGTLVISARNDLIPIPQRIHGLPAFFSRLDLMRDKCREALGGDPKLTGIYYLNPADQWYEFTESGRRALIHPGSLKISSMDKAYAHKALKTSRAPAPAGETNAVKEKIKEEWKTLESGE